MWLGWLSNVYTPPSDEVRLFRARVAGARRDRLCPDDRERNYPLVVYAWVDRPVVRLQSGLAQLQAVLHAVGTDPGTQVEGLGKRLVDGVGDAGWDCSAR